MIFEKNEKDKLNKHYNTFISIYADENEFSNEFIYYVPNDKVEFDSVSVTPYDTNLHLNFYKENYKSYERISRAVKLVIAFSSDYSEYKTGIANSVRLKYNEKEKICLITCLSLIKMSNVKSETDLNKVEIFIVDDNRISKLIKCVDFMLNIKTLSEKLNYINNIKNIYNLKKITFDLDLLRHRIEFLKKIENTDYKYLIRDPKRDEIVTPTFDILLLDCYNLDDYIEIDLSLYEKFNYVNKQKYVTFITHHIPKAKKIEFYEKEKQISTIYNMIECNRMNNYFSLKDENIDYENLIDTNFAKNCCIFYLEKRVEDSNFIKLFSVAC